MSIVRWDTPVSDLTSLALVSLVDDGELAIVVEGSQDSKRERFRFLFNNFFGYKNLLEEYRTALWQSVQGMPHLGWTRRIVRLALAGRVASEGTAVLGPWRRTRGALRVVH